MRSVLAIVLFLSLSTVHAWNYRTTKDEMGRGLIKRAWVESSNQITFDFPYQGPQRAVLQLRIHPEYGNDVLLMVQRGQYLCSSIDGCSVLVRFDEGTAEEYPALGPADHSTNLLFINDYDRFVRGLQKAKRVRIQASFYQQGAKVMSFNVRALKWQRVPEPTAVAPYQPPSTPASEPAQAASAAPAPPVIDANNQRAKECLDEGTKRGLSEWPLTLFWSCPVSVDG